MSDYTESLDSLAIDRPGTGTDVDTGRIITEYNGAPQKTENATVKDEKNDFDSSYTAPKQIFVKRYKLKKM